MDTYKFYDELVMRIPVSHFRLDDLTKDFVIQFFKQKFNQEALYIASPNLCKLFINWVNGNKKISTKEEKKLLNTLFKYYLRMSVRCTPYGLFSSSGIVKWGEKSKIEINDNDYFKETNLDMEFSVELSKWLSEIPLIRENLLYNQNHTLYKKGVEYRLIEYYHVNKIRKHRLISFESNIYLDGILELTRTKCTYKELVQKFSNTFEFEEEESKNYINELIDNQILISNLTPSLSGSDHIFQIFNIIKEIHKKINNNQIDNIYSFIKNIISDLKKMDLGRNEIIQYENIKKRILNDFKLEFDESNFFQTNLYLKSTVNKIDRRLQKQIISTSKLLYKLVTNISNNTTNLEEFKSRFIERYEDKVVPLLEVLDNESGIGYGNKDNRTTNLNDLIQGLSINSYKETNSINWSKTESFLLKKIQHAYSNNLTTITIRKDELKSFEVSYDDLPNTLSVFFSISNDNLILDSISGSTAISLLGRFANGNSEIRNLVKKIAKTETENNDDVLTSEIIHLPEKRTGNILLRPIIREYETPILSNSLLPESNQIPLQDLLISVRNEKIILVSKKYNKQVAPKLSNAHNFSFDSLPVYHFLCDLQFQDFKNDFFFRWGNLISNEFKFLPRVKIEQTIVSRATWNLNKEDYHKVLTGKVTLKQWRNKYNVPRLFYLSDGDNNLLIDSENDFLATLFIDELQKRDFIRLMEFDNQNMLVKDKDNNLYTNEFISTIYREKQLKTKEKVIKKDLKFDKVKLKNKQRTFFIGSQWIYFKIYCGVTTADSILTHEIHTISNELEKKEIISKWFFIRYSDPDNHIRVRFLIKKQEYYQDVINIFHKGIKTLIDDKLVWNVKQETYNRELERYGNQTIELAEDFFHSDSIFCINFLKILIDHDTKNLRWLISMKSIDIFLDSLSFSLEGRKNLLLMMKNSFASEYSIDRATKKEISKRYRDNEVKIQNILIKKDNTYPEIYDFLVSRQEIDTVTSQKFDILYKAMKNDGSVDFSYFSIVSSYIHMMMNRIFASFNRENEMVLYYYLWRYYQSEFSKLNK